MVVHRERFNSMKLDVVSNLFWVPLGPQVQFVREWLALNNLDNIPLAAEILHGGEAPTTTAECEVVQYLKIEGVYPPPPLQVLQQQHHHPLSLQNNADENLI